MIILEDTFIFDSVVFNSSYVNVYLQIQMGEVFFSLVCAYIKQKSLTSFLMLLIALLSYILCLFSVKPISVK